MNRAIPATRSKLSVTTPVTKAAPWKWKML